MFPDVSFPLHGRGETVPVRDRLPLRLLTLSGCTIDAGWRGTDMRSPHWRLYCNLDAGAEVIVRGRATALQVGHVYAVPAWLSWAARCHGRVRHGNALIDLPSLPRERVVERYPEVLHLAAAHEPLARSWQTFLCDQAGAAVMDPQLLARGHALVWASLAVVFQPVGPRAEDVLAGGLSPEFDRLRAWVEERLDQPLPRGALAQFLGCCEAELARRFQRGLGTTPGRWLRDRRLTLAAELLRQSDLTLEAIATRCGLGDRARFTKVFARVMGTPPATWRRRARRS